MQNDRNSTNFLRVLALAFVINSHMELTYPPGLSILASGGMFGNALFFLLSSYGLLLSMRAKPRPLGEWYGRRIVRIYPSVWVLVILLSFPLGIYAGTITSANLLEQLGKFFYPPFWFLQALLFYYLAVFFIINNYSPKRLAIVAGVALAFYAGCYLFLLDTSVFSIESTPFRLIFYFLVILFGLLLGSRAERIQYSGAWDIVLLFFFFACVYGHKYLMRQGIGASSQFIQHLATFPVLYYFLKVAKSRFISETVMGSRYLGAALTFISSTTLELFMVNNSIDFLGPKLGFFPINALLLLALNFGLAILVFLCAKPLHRLLAGGTRD